MPSLTEMIGQQLGGGALSSMAKNLNLDDKKVGLAVAAGLPLLIGALSRNASRKEGAESLDKALNRDHDGSVFNNLGGLLSNPDQGHGDGILRHVLGQKRSAMETGLSRSAGIDQQSAGQVMKMLAPMVMGALGKAKREQKLGADNLSGLLRQETEALERQAPSSRVGGIASILDTDGDGDVDLSDIAKQGSGLLGKFFGGR